MKKVNFLILLVVALSSCVGKFGDDLDKIASPKWSPTLGAPIIFGEFTLEDYVDAISAQDVTITQDNEGVVVIEYTGAPISSDRAEDLIIVPNQSYAKSAFLTLGEINGLPVNVTLSKSFSYDETVTTEAGANDALDSMIFKSGTLQIEITGALPVSGQIDLTLHSLLDNGVPIVRTYAWTYNPANPGQFYSEMIDLTDVIADFTKNGTTNNNFHFDADLTIQYEGQSMNPTDEISINLNIIDPRFRLVYGKFSQRGFLTDLENVQLGLLDNIDAIGFYLDQPAIEFNFKSSFGIPVEAKILTLDAVNKDSQVLPFSGSAIDNPTNVANPSIQEIGNYAETNFVIDRNNSNIVDIIAFLPTELDYQFEGTVKPGSPPEQQFVMDTSEVLAEYTVRLPLIGSVANFTSNRLFDITDNGLQDLEFSLDNTKITLYSENGLPITVDMEVACFDINNNEILTFFANDNLLDPAEIDGTGLAINPSEKVVEETISEADFELLKQVQSIELRSTLFTGKTGAETVKIRMQDKIKVSLFVQTTVTF